jgi:hypothetical protein
MHRLLVSFTLPVLVAQNPNPENTTKTCACYSIVKR